MASATPLRSLRIERGGLRDLDGIVRVMEEAFDPAYGEAWTRSQCAGILPMRGVELSILRDPAGAPDAFALWRTILDQSELLLLAVRPERQGEGLGRLLLDHFTGEATGAGAMRLHLEVRDGNAATRFYERAGFRMAGRRRDYYRGGEGQRFDALTYIKVV